MRFFIFARHAESAANVAHVVSSNPAHDAGLTLQGERQARLLGEQLAHLRIDRAVCTRFRRTRQTIEIALCGRSVPLSVEPELDEVDAGVFDGVAIGAYWTWKELHRSDEAFPGGESIDNALGRYAAGLRRLLERDDQVTLIVCHELALRSILSAARNPTERRADAEVKNAVPYLVDEEALQRALARLRVSRPFEDRHIGAAA